MTKISPSKVEERSFVVEGPVSASCLGELAIDPEMSNFRPAEIQKDALLQIAADDYCKVFIAVSEKVIIGYLAFHQPHELTRWSSLPFILELGAVEISPRWRRQGVGKSLITAAGRHGFMENHVVISLEYAWHWDLEGSGLDMWSYKDVLYRLFSKIGFRVYQTDDPDIMEHPANFFMARVGKNINENQRGDFLNHLYLDSLTYK